MSDVDKYPRLAYTADHPVTDIGALTLQDIAFNPMGVILLGKRVAAELEQLRAENHTLTQKNYALIRRAARHELQDGD